MQSLFLASNSMSFGERLTLSGQMLFVGIAVVFAVLALLWLLLAIMKYFVCDFGRKKPKTDGVSVTENSAPVEQELEEVSDDSELVAAITAAIAAYRSESGLDASRVPFKVVSYKRKSGNTEWNIRR